MKPLVILVDLQEDFLNNGTIEPSSSAIVYQAAQLLQHCRILGVPVAHVWTTVSRQPDNRMPHWKQADCRRCEAGTAGHEPPAQLRPRDGEAVIAKQVFTGFGSSLRDVIRDRAIDTLIVAGVHLHACVRQTVLDAYQAGLHVCVVEDAVASDDPIHAAITRRYLEARGVLFASVAAVVAQLASGQQLSPLRRPQETARQAVDRAASLTRAWRKTAPDVRVRLVQQLAGLLADRAGELADLMATEIGKPVRFGRVEVERTAEMLGAITRHHRILHEVAAAGPALVRRRPLGVVAVITPWNNPIYLALGKIVPAVVFGNPVVWKPAPEARRVSRRVRELLYEAGWPEDLVSLLEGGRAAGEELINNAAIAAVTLTGSLAAGTSAQEVCGRRRIPLQAELGGNNAAIVWPDADLADAARQIAAGAFDMAGQRCTANRRVIVQESWADRFLDLLVRESAALPWGDPRQPETRIGPLVSTAQRERVAAMVDRAVAQCGPALLPHGPGSPAGNDEQPAWFPPTILRCAEPWHEIVQEETFGPVLVVQTARAWDDAMRLCNGVRQGLAAAIFTGSSELAERFLEEAEAGILKVNQSTADAAVDVPFGGWKASGLGPPEHGTYDIEFYTRPQAVYGGPPAISQGTDEHGTVPPRSAA